MSKSKSAYSQPTKFGKEDHHIIVVWVDNEAGVLARVIGLFSGRGYNIESLAVAEIDKNKHLSRITIVTKGTPEVIQQIKLQLRKLIPVHKVADFSRNDPKILFKELALLKVVGATKKLDKAKKLCKKINSSSMGILICGSGIGVNISANRHKHIRASLCHDVATAKITRKHNDSNVICLKGRPFVKKNIFAMLDAYFSTEFEEGRHKRRVKQL